METHRIVSRTEWLAAGAITTELSHRSAVYARPIGRACNTSLHWIFLKYGEDDKPETRFGTIEV